MFDCQSQEDYRLLPKQQSILHCKVFIKITAPSLIMIYFQHLLYLLVFATFGYQLQDDEFLSLLLK